VEAVEVSNEEQQQKPAQASAPVPGADAHFEDYLDVCVLDLSAKRKRMAVLVEPLDPETGKPAGRILAIARARTRSSIRCSLGRKRAGQLRAPLETIAATRARTTPTTELARLLRRLLPLLILPLVPAGGLSD
jgi:hypothetical protein